MKRLFAPGRKAAELELPVRDHRSAAGEERPIHPCLNCGAELSGHYCSHCGQSAHTHRLSILHFVAHDLVHSLWHIDRGIVYTLREVLLRPGYAALDYIRGKRAGKFPILTLLLLLLGAIFWLESIRHGTASSDIVQIKETGDGNDSAVAYLRRVGEFLKQNRKWILLSLLPVASLSTLTIFRKVRLNYTEHLVVNSHVFGGVLVGYLATRLIVLAFPGTDPILEGAIPMLIMLFYAMGYWQAYHAPYRLAGMIWRYVALVLLNTFLLMLAMGAIFYAAYMLSPDFHKAIHH